MKILVAEKSAQARAFINQVLKSDYVIDIFDNYQDAYDTIGSHAYSLVIASLNLSKDGSMDGLALGRYAKELDENTAVVIICDRDDESFKEKVYFANLDDCLVKPFGSRELTLKVQRVLQSRELNITEAERNVLTLRNIKYDLDKRVVYCNGERISLRRKEMKLLEYFLRNQGKVVTRDELLTNVWGVEINNSTNTVEVHLKRLRDKIEKPYGERFLFTIHGIGYLAE